MSVARRKRGFSANLKSPTNGRFWEEYGREDDMRIPKARKAGMMRAARPKSYRPRKKRYGGRSRTRTRR